MLCLGLRLCLFWAVLSQTTAAAGLNLFGGDWPDGGRHSKLPAYWVAAPCRLIPPTDYSVWGAGRLATAAASLLLAGLRPRRPGPLLFSFAALFPYCTLVQ